MTPWAQDGAAEPLRLGDLGEDRFGRLGLIQWWDQSLISQTKVMVVGAGALGNEILKNLALLGFRQILVVDMDRIELSNLSRSVLYRPADVGSSKASTAAAATQRIYEDATVHFIDGSILHDVGLGVFAWADIVLAGLDNREARLWINRSCWKMNRPWIDGAIEGLSGVARVFLPGRLPCYECTLGEVDWQILANRLSCNLLTRTEMEGGRTPTTPTIASIIGGLQVQEAVKLIHGQPVLAGRGYVFDGVHHTSYVVEYTETEDCMSHYTAPSPTTLEGGSEDWTLSQLFERARSDLNTREVVLDFSRDVIWKLRCPQCGEEEEALAAVGAVSLEQGRCPYDGTVREAVVQHGYDGSGPLGDRRWNEVGLPAHDCVTARSDLQEASYVFEADAKRVLGPLIAAYGQAHSQG
jgi:adenylyltransferase/sulfurtransferase